MTPVRFRGNAILRRLPSGPVTVAEVGCFVATLSKFLLESRQDLRLIMVDNWAPSEDQPETYRSTGDRHAHQSADECRMFRLMAKARVHRYGSDRVLVRVMHSVEAAETMDETLDLVFLDGDHSYEGLSADLRAWEPRVRPGGWLGGHDYLNDAVPGADLTGVEKAVTEWAGNGHKIELDADYTWFCRMRSSPALAGRCKT